MEQSKLEQAFWTYHAEHPEVYELLVHYARMWRSHRGSDAVVSVGLLWERVRWEVALYGRHTDAYKCNNDHRAYYARLLMEREPELAGIFRLRRQRIPATFGPEKGDQDE